MFIYITEVFIISFIGTIFCCPSNWVALESQCYYFSKSLGSYYEAEVFCRSQQATLATIDDETKMFMAAVVLHAELQYDNKAFWIGADDMEKEGQWRWISNHKLIPLDSPFWFTNQPQGGGAENCLALNPCWDSACYHDYDCNRGDLHYICERSNFTQNGRPVG